MKVLVTCGPTWVAIDDVRVISNISSGQMGHLIATAFKQAGAQVTVIEGPVTDGLKLPGVKVVKYKFFDELSKALKVECAKKYDIVVHAAAVSDFKVVGRSKTKLNSDKPLVLELTPTEKLIQNIKRIAPHSFLVGFKLASSIKPSMLGQLTRTLFTESQCDVVIANSVKRGYSGYIVDADGMVIAKATRKEKIAQEIVRIIR